LDRRSSAPKSRPIRSHHPRLRWPDQTRQRRSPYLTLATSPFHPGAWDSFQCRILEMQGQVEMDGENRKQGHELSTSLQHALQRSWTWPPPFSMSLP
jgi:hypothetical protein